MKGAPWHCGFPMEPGGGNQAAGVDSWLAFRCENCAHQEVVWGHLTYDSNGLPETFVARPRKTLTILMERLPLGGVRCRGISQDADIFSDLCYGSVDVAMKQISKFYLNRGFRCVFDLPKGDQS